MKKRIKSLFIAIVISSFVIALCFGISLALLFFPLIAFIKPDIFAPEDPNLD